LNIRRVVEVSCLAAENRKLIKAVEQVTASCIAARDDISGTEGRNDRRVWQGRVWDDLRPS